MSPEREVITIFPFLDSKLYIYNDLSWTIADLMMGYSIKTILTLIDNLSFDSSTPITEVNDLLELKEELISLAINQNLESLRD